MNGKCERCDCTSLELVSIDSNFYMTVCIECEIELAEIQYKNEPEINPER